MPEDEVRVSDLEREQVVQELGEHFAEGRLSDDELSERSEKAYEARTNAELRSLLADMPQLPAKPEEERAELQRRRGLLQRRLLQDAGGGLVAFLVCTGIWAAAGASGSFWPIWIALFALIPLVRNGWRLYGPEPELDRVEQELARRGREGRRHRHRHRHR
jgi:hypothetical protein